MMADEIKFGITGLESVLGKMQEVQHDVKRRGGRTALRKAAQLVAEAAQQNARRLDDPETANQIAENIALRWSSRTFKRTGNLAFRVGVLGGARSTSKAALKSAQQRRRAGTASLASMGEIAGAGKQNPGGDTFYWRFHEFGTSQLPARPFLRPALENNISRATDEFVRQYDRALGRAIARAKKAASKA